MHGLDKWRQPQRRLAADPVSLAHGRAGFGDVTRLSRGKPPHSIRSVPISTCANCRHSPVSWRDSDDLLVCLRVAQIPHELLHPGFRVSVPSSAADPSGSSDESVASGSGEPWGGRTPKCFQHLVCVLTVKRCGKRSATKLDHLLRFEQVG